MYCTAAEVRNMLKSDVLNSLIGNEFIEDEAVREAKLAPIVAEAVADADGEIDGYLSKRYPVPLTVVPKVINKLSKDIALYNLFSRMGIDEGERESNYLTRYKAAIRFLEMVARGGVDIGVSDNTKKADSSFSLNQAPRLFSRKSLEGM